MRALALFVASLLGTAVATAETPVAAERDDTDLPGVTLPVSLTPGGLVQVDAVPFRQSSEDQLDPATLTPLNEERFALRRALARLDGESGIFRGRFELEATTLSGVVVRPRQAFLGFEVPQERWGGFGLAGEVGLVQIPFGGETRQPLTEMVWLERSTFVRALFPGQFDLGVSLRAEYEVFSLALALMNGEPIGESGFWGLDPNSSKDFIGRTGVDAPLGKGASLRIGASFSYGEGFHPGTPATKDRLAFRDNNENGLVEVSELSILPGAPATPSQNFERFAVGADLRLRFVWPHLGVTTFFAELVRGVNLDRGVEPADPVARGRDLRELGFSFGLSQRLLRYFEVGVRYDEYNPDSDARRFSGINLVPRDASYRTLACSVAGRLGPARLLVEYDHRQNSLGRDVSGAPTTLADDALILRAEYVLQ